MAEKEALDKKAQEILEEKDADSRLRVYKGPLGKAIIVPVSYTHLMCIRDSSSEVRFLFAKVEKA